MCIYTSVNIDLYIHTPYRSILCTYIHYLPIPVSTHSEVYMYTNTHVLNPQKHYIDMYNIQVCMYRYTPTQQYLNKSVFIAVYAHIKIYMHTYISKTYSSTRVYTDLHRLYMKRHICGGDVDIYTYVHSCRDYIFCVDTHNILLSMSTCACPCVSTCTRLCVDVCVCFCGHVCEWTCVQDNRSTKTMTRAPPKASPPSLPLPDSTASFPKDLLKHRTETGTHRARSGCRGVAHGCRCHHARGIPIPVPAVLSVPPTSPPSACPKPSTCGPPATPQQCQGFQQGSSRRGLAQTPRGRRDSP